MDNYVYWFTEHLTEYDVLVNIYVLLFLYVFGILFLKFITIIHNVKWKDRR